jgi:hypothetical protein
MYEYGPTFTPGQTCTCPYLLEVLVLKGGDFGRWLSHRKKALINETNILRRGFWKSPHHSHHVRLHWEYGYDRDMMAHFLIDTKSAGVLILGFHIPELWW